ncbi:SFRICE_006165 [Gryllus bimaculatus]|nr:SFRICE_006165 [Gryllus bimaculatus]
MAASAESKVETENVKTTDKFLLRMQECYENYIVIDSGANLTNKKYGRDLESVIQRAKDAGVMKIVVTGASLRSSKEALRLTRLYPGVIYSTAGIHPHDAKSWTEGYLDDLREIALNPECVAIGECGLDYNRDFSPAEIQREVLQKQRLFRNIPLSPSLTLIREAQSYKNSLLDLKFVFILSVFDIHKTELLFNLVLVKINSSQISIVADSDGASFLKNVRNEEKWFEAFQIAEKAKVIYLLHRKKILVKRIKLGDTTQFSKFCEEFPMDVLVSLLQSFDLYINTRFISSYTVIFCGVGNEVALACELQKPLFIHEREAHKDLLDILEKFRENLPTVVMHCFTGSLEQAEKYINMGIYIGITGYLCKDKSDTGVRKILESGLIPLEQLLVETDSPFMYPNTRASKLPTHVKEALTDRSLMFLQRYCTFQRNEPCSLPAIVEMIAAFMKKRPEEVALATAFNSMKVFGLT